MRSSRQKKDEQQKQQASYFLASRTSAPSFHGADRKGGGGGGGGSSSSSSSSSSISIPRSDPILSKPPHRDRPQKPPEKSRGFWTWRPFRTSPSPPSRLCFHVLFSLDVHSVHALPPSMNGLRLAVLWKRKNEGIQTMPSRVVHGYVEFNETLRQRCKVLGTRNSNQVIKYEAKLFTLSAVALDMNGLELGKHHVDLSHLLPEEDIDQPDAQHGSGWKTTFQLSGRAKGGYLSVTFNYDVLHHEAMVGEDSHYDDDDHDDTDLLPMDENPVSNAAQSSDPAMASSHLSSTIARPDSDSTAPSEPVVLHPAQESYVQLQAVEPHLPSSFQDIAPVDCPSPVVPHAVKLPPSSAVHHLLIEHGTAAQSESKKLAEISNLEETCIQTTNKDTKSVHKTETDFEDEIELVAGEFLDMLDIGFGSPNPDSEGEPESPRERLLKQCESLLAAGTIGDSAVEGTGKEDFDLNLDAEDDQHIVSIMEAAELELQKAVQTAQSKTRAKALEDEETQALMRKWGLSEKTFQNSPPKSVTSSLQTPHLPSPPPLGNGLGPVLKFKDGGSLRSMNPAHFPKASINGGSLVMQASKPVVVPSAMGSTAVDILRHLASFGADTLAKQAMAAMPFEDISGMLTDGVMSLQQGDQRDHNSYHHEHRNQASSLSGSRVNMESERLGIKPDFTNNRSKEKSAGGYDDYVSLEDLAPLAMQNIEALAIDGLKVQADMADEDAPSYLDAAAWGILGDKKEDNISLSDSVAGLHFKSLESMDAFSAEAKQIGPLSMAITLEEWSKLDVGALDDGERTKERSLAILAAHNAHHQDCELANREDGKRGHTRKGGIMGNTLMIAMLVQLRDPLRNFEPVGAPMMTLIQAERVMVPPKPRIGRRVSVKGNNEVDDDDEAKSKVSQKDDIPQFKLTGVHMSGLKPIEDDEMKVERGTEIQKKGWGNEKQVQSGSRWLLAQGMSKSSSKHSLLKSKAAPAAQTKVKPGETLWSISARVNGSRQKWRDLAALNPHIRNPDVIFTNDKIRTK